MSSMRYTNAEIVNVARLLTYGTIFPGTFFQASHQTATSPAIAANKNPRAFKDIAPLDGTVSELSPVEEVSPVGELSSDVALGVPVLRVMEEPVMVDILVLVDAPVVLIDEDSVVVESSLLVEESSLVVEAALVAVAELGEEETDSTVLSDSTTNCAE
ncbi:MAG: hypothetical protein Q9205_003045 [Flavoplaca limonia]